MPGAGHIVHMPAHIYYRVGLYRESLELNRRAIAVDEAYFKTSPSDPLYRSAYYPHNIHFAMVSAQMGGDGRTATLHSFSASNYEQIEIIKERAVAFFVKMWPKMKENEDKKSVQIEGFRLIKHTKYGEERPL